MRNLGIFIASATLFIFLSDGVSQSHANASLDLVFQSHSGLGVGACAGAGRNSGNIVSGRAEGIGFGSGNALCTMPGDTISGQVLLNIDACDELKVFIYSVIWDDVTGGPGSGASDSGNLQDELDLLVANEINTVSQSFSRVLRPQTAGLASTQESVLGVQRGEALQFEAFTFGPGLQAGGNPYVVGNFTMFVTSNVVTDGRDIFAGFFPGVFAFGFNFLTQTTVATVGLDVNFVPEPSTAGLVGTALLAVTAIARRRGVRSARARRR